MQISENLKEVLHFIPENVKLIAVSKNHSPEQIMEAYQAGQRCFGENKVQELLQKQPLLPADIEWHLIGHLQTNKVKYLAPFVSCIHSVDSLKLLQTINKEAEKNTRVIDCLLQMHIAQEDTKFGMNMDELTELLQDPDFSLLQNVRICGLMGMATFTDDMEHVRQEFKTLKHAFDAIREKWYAQKTYFSEISMGMSDDFHVAIEEGSTMVRVGTAIFGSRGY